MNPNVVEDVRARVMLALLGGTPCPGCGRQDPQPMTARELARRTGIKPGVIRRFVKGGDILASNLALLDAHTFLIVDANEWPELPPVQEGNGE